MRSKKLVMRAYKHAHIHGYVHVCVRAPRVCAHPMQPSQIEAHKPFSHTDEAHLRYASCTCICKYTSINALGRVVWHRSNHKDMMLLLSWDRDPLQEITRRVNRENIWQAVYTAGVVLPRPISECRALDVVCVGTPIAGRYGLCWRLTRFLVGFLSRYADPGSIPKVDTP